MPGLRRRTRSFLTNCGDSPASLPAPLSDSPSPAVAADRAYQIAAAHFYAGEFAEAERQFRAIAQDEASPWKVMAAYLVGRALVRQGTVDEPENSERLQAAVAHLRGVLADPSLAEVHGPAERLLGYALLQLDPADRARTLLRELRAPVLGPTAGSTLFDYLWLLRREEGRGMYYPRGFGTISILDPSASLGESPFEFDEVGVWLLGYYPVDHWRRTRSLPWLVAAMTAVGPTQPDRDALLAAAEKVPRDSPAYPTLAYHRMRLMIAEGHLEHARRELDRLLAEPEGTFAAGDRNRLQALRAPLATNLDEFLRLAQKVPVGVSYDDGEVPFRSVSQPELAALRGQPMLDDDAADMLNRDFTPAMLLEVARRDALVARLRSDVARAAWVRALLLAEWELADQIGLLVAQLAPDLGPEVDAMGAAASPAREFTVAFMLLRLPRLQHEIGARGEEPWSAWRCAAAGDPARRNAVAPALAFQTDDQRAAVAAMHERLRALQPGQLWLGRTVLAWADQHPEDPRVPEALHQVVHQSREECTRDRSAMVQRAFRRLHRRYPSSLWTVKTPYWHR